MPPASRAGPRAALPSAPGPSARPGRRASSRGVPRRAWRVRRRPARRSSHLKASREWSRAGWTDSFWAQLTRRTPQMKVIGAGFGRTGTMSLKGALEQLGFGPSFHMIDVARFPELLPQWQAAADGESADWAKVFEGWESTVDWPACTYWEQIWET